MRDIATNLFFFVLVLFLVMLFEGSFNINPKAPNAAPLQQGVVYGVRRVVDGDTVVLYKGDREETVRVLGIDAPETEKSPDGPECFASEATQKAKDLLEGQTVTFTQDATQDERDAYGRLLGYITLPDGSDFGATMITQGYAKEYTFKGRVYRRQTTYTQDEVAAQMKGLGLWSCE